MIRASFVTSVISTETLEHIKVCYRVRQQSPHSHRAAQYSLHDWKIDRGLFLRGFCRNGHLVFPVQDARKKSVIQGAIRCQQLKKKLAAGKTTYEVVVLIYLPFLSGSLASPSCLTASVSATGYRSHPITLLLHFFYRLFVHQEVFKKEP